jgi:lipopolysaccharide export system permease protein
MLAPRILWRYLLRDVSQHILLAIAVLAVVLVVAGLLQRLDELIAVGAEPVVLLQLSAIILPSYLVLAVPTALVFGALLAFGRMCGDGEIIAMRAAGISVMQLVPPLLLIGAITAGLGAYITFDLEPRSHYQMKTLLRSLLKSTSLIEPGRIRRVRDAQTIYVDSLGDESCPLRGVFISDFTDPARPFYMTARCGEISSNSAETRGLALDLTDGTIDFAGIDEHYRRASFVRGATELDLSGTLFQSKRLQHYPMEELFGDEVRERFKAPAISAEVHRRLAIPAGSLLLALLVLPLGISAPRSGRSAGALIALLVMGPYWGGMTAAQLIAENDLVPGWVAMWAPNVVLAGLVIWLLRRASRAEV